MYFVQISPQLLCTEWVSVVSRHIESFRIVRNDLESNLIEKRKSHFATAIGTSFSCSPKIAQWIFRPQLKCERWTIRTHDIRCSLSHPVVSQWMDPRNFAWGIRMKRAEETTSIQEYTATPGNRATTTTLSIGRDEMWHNTHMCTKFMETFMVSSGCSVSVIKTCFCLSRQTSFSTFSPQFTRTSEKQCPNGTIQVYLW